MEIIRSAYRNGLLAVLAAAGTPEAISLAAFRGRYVKVYSPDSAVYFNLVTEDPGTSPTLSYATGDASTTAEVAGSGTPDIADSTAAAFFGEHVAVPDTADVWLVFDAASGSDVRIIIKPSSPARSTPQVGI
jgi:hypothetical protein